MTHGTVPSLISQARAQDVNKVLDPLYTPTTTEERDLFIEKQKFLYAVLESKVLTDRGKAVIREQEQTVMPRLCIRNWLNTTSDLPRP